MLENINIFDRLEQLDFYCVPALKLMHGGYMEELGFKTNVLHN